MKIGLIDVDGHGFPNLPLMKLSAYHKSIGDQVEWYDGLGGGIYDKGKDQNLPEEIEHIYPDYSLYGEMTDNKDGILCHNEKV